MIRSISLLRTPLQTFFKSHRKMIHSSVIIRSDDGNEMSVYNRNTMSAKDMMREDGVYTTGRTIGGDRVVEFDLHARRIIDPYPECDMREEDIERIIGYAFRELNEFEEEKRFTLFRDENRALYCHAERLPPRPSSPIITAIRGKPRENPDIKSTTWIKERSVLESDEIHEVLLTDDRGRLFEGSQTNVFVVEKDGRIRTANEGILPGTIRNIIVEECKRENIPIDMSPPLISEMMDSWDAVFLTSTSRLVLEVDEIRGDHQSKVFRGSHPVVRDVERMVLESLGRRSRAIPRV